MHNETLFRELVGEDRRESVLALLAAVVLSVVFGRALTVDALWVPAAAAVVVGGPLAFVVAYRSGGLLVSVVVMVVSASVADGGVIALVSLPVTLLLGPFIAPGAGFAFAGVVVYVAARTVARRWGNDPLGPIDRALCHRDGWVATAGGVAGLAVGLLRAVATVSGGTGQWVSAVVLLAVGLAVYVRGGGYLGVVGVGVGSSVPVVADADGLATVVVEAWFAWNWTGGIALLVVAVGVAGRFALDRIVIDDGSGTGEERPVTLDDARTGLVWAAPWFVLVPVAAVDPAVAGSARLAVAYVACVLVVLAVGTGSLVAVANGRFESTGGEDRRPQRLAGGTTGLVLVGAVAVVV